jgi:hypothetical protein
VNRSPLTDLAWASLPERAIISRVANELLRRGIDGGRGEKGDVKDAVRASCPPRGLLTSRYQGVLAALAVQKGVRNKRRWDAAPYVWERPTLEMRRLLVARARLEDDNISACYDIRVARGHTVYVVAWNRHYSLRTYLVVRHYVSNSTTAVDVGKGLLTFAQAVAAIHAKEISRAVMAGGFYTIDICRMVTTIHPLDGPSFDLHWPIVDEPHPLHRPRPAQCENWA